MRKKQTTQAPPETSQVVVFRRPSKTAVVLCPECACGMLTLEEAVALAQVGSRVIHRRVEEGLLHFTETPEGYLLICLNSLVRQG